MSSLLLALLVGEGASRMLRKHESESEFCPLELEPVICQRGNVKVRRTNVGDPKGNLRKMQFGDECAVESVIKCKGEPGKFEMDECNGGCGACPCDYDPTQGLSAHYMDTMFQELSPWCNSTVRSRVLSIGLGGGEMPQYLLHHCPHMSVEAVELSRDVIETATLFFGIQEVEKSSGGRLKVEQGDAGKVVAQKPAGQYDAVLVDCFQGGGVVPEGCRSEAFAKNVQKLLTPSGVMLQNIWHKARGHPEVAGQFQDTMKVYKDVFNGRLLDIHVPMPVNVRWVEVLKAGGNVTASRDS